MIDGLPIVGGGDSSLMIVTDSISITSVSELVVYFSSTHAFWSVMVVDLNTQTFNL